MQFISNLVIQKKILDPNITIYNLAKRTLKNPSYFARIGYSSCTLLKQ